MTPLSSAQAYFDLGWHPLALPPRAKETPSRRYTGADGIDAGAEKVAWLASATASENIALRMPLGVVGVDVDDYEKNGKAKHGAAQLAALEAELGELPATWSSGNRGLAPSRIRFYRVPAGVALQHKFADDIEAIQRHHRYAVVSPSVHPELRSYEWFAPDGEKAELPCNPGELPELPTAWVERFRDASVRKTASSTAARLWLEERSDTAGLPCGEMATAVEMGRRSFNDDGSGHQLLAKATMRIVAKAGNGHRGVTAALEDVKAVFAEYVAKRRCGDEVEREFESLVRGAVAKVERNRNYCNCPPSQRVNYVLPGLGLAAEKFAQAVLEAGAIARGADGSLWAYSDGQWSPGGNAEVNRRAAVLLGDAYRTGHVEAVSGFISGVSEPLSADGGDPAYLNLPNGLLNWATGELEPHRPDVGVLPRIPVDWQPNAQCPYIREWLVEVVGPDNVQLMFEIAGYCLLAAQPVHRAFLFTGHGRNGKGSFIRLLEALVGKANTSSVAPQELNDKFLGAELYGKLANLVGDVSAATFKDTAVFKKLTGGDTVNAQRKFGQPFDFVSMATTVASFNELPRSADTTEGFFSRWIVVPFEQSFVGREDAKVELRLHAEMQGLLVAAVEGLRGVVERNGFRETAATVAAKDEFKRLANPMYAFIDDALESGWLKPGFVNRVELYAEYAGMWCKEAGFGQLGRTTFYQRLERALVARGMGDGRVVQRKSEAARGYWVVAEGAPARATEAL